MQFGVLGPLRVMTGEPGEPVMISAARLRVLLAVLLWRANHPIAVDELAKIVWDGMPPPGAADAVRALVMRLRKAVGQPVAARIVTRAPGYAIEASGQELDASRFEALAREAGQAAADGRWGQAAQWATAALELWRGEPLADVSCQVLQDRWAPRLEQARAQVLEWRFEAGLHEGRHAQLIPELQDATRRHPLREQFHGQLMLALYRSGRQAEALAAYQRARDALVAELGVEPGPGLRALHQQVLSAAPVLGCAGQADPAQAAPWELPPTVPGQAAQAGPAGAAPRDLPPTVQGFTGRAAELKALTQALDQAGTGAPGTVVISAVGGTAGVGKTALALHWAHQVADRFPDGQLYVNLRGFAPSGTPATPAEVIRGFLDALGVPPGRIPPAPDAQAGLYRSLLADRTMLIVLDNARDEHQVRPLLPASPASLVLVTSRSQLTGLAAADGARLMSLGLLTREETAHLLSARLGKDRAAAEPGAINEIAALCAHLPLALAIAAARADARPRFPLAQLAAELRGAADRLDALETGDPAVSVRSVFSWSYQQLSPQAARMFRLLGLHPGPDIAIPAAASLAAVDESQARRLLAHLTRECLITEHAPGRYAFHDLLRAYAASQARDHDPEADRDAANGRILDHYLHTASHSRRLLRRPEQEPMTLPPPSPGTRPEQPADHRQALAWFTAEHQALLATAALAAEKGTDRRAWQLPCAMAEYFRRRGYPHVQVTVMASAVAAATRLGDPLGRAMSLRRLGYACHSTGDFQQARAHLEHCLPLYQQLGDRKGQAVAQQNLAYVAEAQGRYADALRHIELARGLHRATSDQLAEAETLANSGWYHALLGDYQRASAFCQQALTLTGTLGNTSFQHCLQDTLGYIEHHHGNLSQAAAHFETALALSRDISDAPSEAEILSHLGDVRHDAGEMSQARQAWQQALAIYDDIQHPDADKLRAKLAREMSINLRL